MEKQEQREKEAEEAINAINKKTGRNMPQAIATAVVLIAIILACLLISVDLFVYLVVLFMVLALWELRVDFATAGLHIPVVALWACSAVTLLATYYSKHHIVAMTVCVLRLLAACSDRRKCQGDVRQSAFPGRGGQTVAHRCRCSSRIVVQS